MIFNAKNGVVELRDGEMEYIRFGRGSRVLVILPGLGDGLRTAKGTALPMAVMYRIFQKDFTVYVFSRRMNQPVGHNTRDMARDVAEAMGCLGITHADVLGVSMGGMIAQYLALDHGDRVNKLVLVVTSSRSNPVLEESIGEWMDCVERDDHTGLMVSNLRRIYSESYCRNNQWMVPLLARLTKPKSYDRFRIQAKACLDHDAYDSLRNIKSPTLVIGGEKDLALGGGASVEIAERIPGARLLMYPQWGHGLYEEAKDFNQVIFEFLI